MHAHAERDEWLMAQAALGQREPLELLIRRYAQPLVGFLTRMVRDRHRGEELFQEVFLAVWRKRQQYKFPRPFKPWLYAIALNKGRAAFRCVRPEQPLDLAAAPPVVAGDSPADVVLATETATLVARVVHQLPPQQRAVVVLRVWDGLPYAEIAQIVRCSEATVRSHMHHGLRALRVALGNHLD